jgi:type II pantothenate kinase
MISCGVDAGCSDTKCVYDAGGILIYKTIKAGESTALESGVQYAFTGAKGKELKMYAPGDAKEFPEFECAATGTARLTGLSNFLMVNMGTGTSFVRVTGENIEHLGGSGLGGGTITGLMNAKNGLEKSVDEICRLAADGDRSHTDLRVIDVFGKHMKETELLSGDVTVSNLQRLDRLSSDADFAAGMINMLAESILMMAVLAHRGDEKIVCVGGLSRMCQMRHMAKLLGDMHHIEFVFPEAAAYVGALGCLHKLKNI